MVKVIDACRSTGGKLTKTPVDLKPVPSYFPPSMGVVSVGCDGGGPLGGGGGAGKLAGAKACGLRCQAPSGALVKYLPGSIGALPKLIVPGPLTCDHMPVPTLGELPAKAVISPHTDWSGPAAEVVGLAVYVTVTSSVELQLPLAIVQRKVYAPCAETVAVDVAELALLKVVVPGPPTCDHVPVPT